MHTSPELVRNGMFQHELLQDGETVAFRQNERMTDGETRRDAPVRIQTYLSKTWKTNVHSTPETGEKE